MGRKCGKGLKCREETNKYINEICSFRNGREHLVIGHGEIVVTHQRMARRVVAVVRVRQVAVAVHIHVTVVGYQQVGPGPEYRTSSVNNTTSVSRRRLSFKSVGEHLKIFKCSHLCHTTDTIGYRFRV